MTETLLGLLLLAGLYPLWQARKANRGSALIHAVHWAIIAWLGWVTTVVVALFADQTAERTSAYVALCLTGCAGVAVLGARRPSVAAWTFVVVGLLAVQMLPVAEGLEHFRNSPLFIGFLSTTLAVAIGNYLPTRMGPAALLAGVAMMPDLLLLAGRASWSTNLILPAHYGRGVLALVPWLAWLGIATSDRKSCPIDTLWRSFRDRFGFVWGQRLREQFNKAIANAGWPARLSWVGIHAVNGGTVDEHVGVELLEMLQSMLRRF
jgi:hypothetical protein